MRILSFILAAAFVAAFSFVASAQQTILQGGGWTPGHATQYLGGSFQPIVGDAGSARGGGNGVGLSELLLTARGTGTSPFNAQGTGPFGTIACMNDGPTDGANGYHFLCFSPNVGGSALIAYGAGGIATPGILKFNINGVAITPVDCSGSPTSSFATVNGIVTHC